MKKTLMLLLSSFFSVVSIAQKQPESYRITSEKFEDFYNGNQADSLYHLFGEKMKTAVPVDKVSVMITQLKSQFGQLKNLEFNDLKLPAAFYNAVFEKGNYIMTISLDDQNKLNGFYFRPQTAVSKPVAEGLKESPVNVNVSDGKLSGSLVLPENANGKIPVVLIIAGSGPTDRNGNSSLGVNANPYFLLANDLGKAGIATLRYDKRGVGESTSSKPENELHFDDFVNDAVALIKQLKADARFSKVIVLGHSEGSLIGMLAAEKEKVDAFISVAGAGNQINKILADQLKNESPQEYKITLNRLDSLSKGIRVNAAQTDALFRPSVQPFMISWMKYNPQIEIKKLQILMLIIQGTHDLHVSVADAKKLKKANSSAKLVLIDGMNHVLKPASSDREKNLATYNYPKLPLDTNFKNAVINFVHQLK